ncbi:hypothetical protein V7O62_07190 [Methanolobus sp. ZRKC2]|uniref:hypothetical protein n=1 Tax=Methanolobus sp. ZRKC2 TaxID=3125783 RepID=UPI00324BEAC4
MKLQGKKVLACFSLMLMVLSIVPSGAVVNTTDTDSNGTYMLSPECHFREKGPLRNGHGMEKPEFETEEEELEFMKERITEATERRIERLQNLDETANENVTEESVEEKIAELETLIEEVNNASTLEELKEIMAEMKRPEFETEEEELEFMKGRITEVTEKKIERLQNFNETTNENVTEESVEEKIAELETLIEEVNNASTLEELKEIMAEMKRPEHRMEKPVFETEEEEIEFVKERIAESIDRRIKMLESIDPENFEELTSDDIESIISQLEDIKASLDNEDLTLDDLKEMKKSIFQIMETVRENIPAPENNRKRIPHHMGPMEEAEEN